MSRCDDQRGSAVGADDVRIGTRIQERPDNLYVSVTGSNEQRGLDATLGLAGLPTCDSRVDLINVGTGGKSGPDGL